MITRCPRCKVDIDVIVSLKFDELLIYKPEYMDKIILETSYDLSCWNCTYFEEETVELEYDILDESITLYISDPTETKELTRKLRKEYDSKIREYPIGFVRQ